MHQSHLGRWRDAPGCNFGELLFTSPAILFFHHSGMGNKSHAWYISTSTSTVSRVNRAIQGWLMANQPFVAFLFSDSSCSSVCARISFWWKHIREMFLCLFSLRRARVNRVLAACSRRDVFRDLKEMKIQRNVSKKLFSYACKGDMIFVMIFALQKYAPSYRLRLHRASSSNTPDVMLQIAGISSRKKVQQKVSLCVASFSSSLHRVEL